MELLAVQLFPATASEAQSLLEEHRVVGWNSVTTSRSTGNWSASRRDFPHLRDPSHAHVERVKQGLDIGWTREGALFFQGWFLQFHICF